MATRENPYPIDPEKLAFQDVDGPAPDQTYFLSWVAQFNRLWLALFCSIALNLGQVTALVITISKFEPSTEFVDITSAGPVVMPSEGVYKIGDSEYEPIQVRAVIRRFIESRYAYSHKNIEKINTARELMSPAGAAAEMKKIEAADLANNIVAKKATYSLEIDMSNWDIDALGSGRFRIKVPVRAEINDAFRHSDPEHPFVKNWIAELVVERTRASDLNPYGYWVVETGNDVIIH